MSKKATGFGRVTKAILTLASGKVPRLMAMECIFGLMGIAMKVNGGPA